MKNLHLLPLLVLLVFLSSSCTSNYGLELMVAEEDATIMHEIAREINVHSKFKIRVLSEDSLTEVTALERLQAEEFDITTIDNTLDYHESKKELRTIIPFFHEVLVVISRKRLTQVEVDSLIREKKYMVLTKEVDELDFFNQLIPSFTGDSSINYRLENHYDLEEDLQNHEVLLFFSALENYELGRLLFNKKAYIYSLDHEQDEGHGSFIEGFCEFYKKTTPYILSRLAFGVTLEKPTYTLAVHELLVTSSSVPSKIIYDLVQAIHQHHIVPIFESSNSYTFEVNHQDINLSFPFHSGTVNYLNRDKPSFIERYSEFMGFVLSVFIVLFGLTASLRATINQRKKDRMDEYYRKLLNLKDNIRSIPHDKLRDELCQMQKVVFDLLIREKLSANNEFVIFMMLWDELQNEMIDMYGKK